MKYKRGKLKKGGKFKNIHCRTWNITKKLKIMENENIRQRRKNNEITKNIKNKMHTEGPGI